MSEGGISMGEVNRVQDIIMPGHEYKIGIHDNFYLGSGTILQVARNPIRLNNEAVLTTRLPSIDLALSSQAISLGVSNGSLLLRGLGNSNKVVWETREGDELKLHAKKSDESEGFRYSTLESGVTVYLPLNETQGLNLRIDRPEGNMANIAGVNLIVTTSTEALDMYRQGSKLVKIADSK